MDKKYSVEIIESSMTLTKRDKLRLTDTTEAVKLDIVTADGASFVMPVNGYVVLSIHNEFSSNQDYTVFGILDTEGKLYTTGSESFWTSFKEIWDTMRADGDDEDFEIEIYRHESKNYKGKTFITCRIV